ncbi:MAG: hypothetical protein ACI9XK_004011 [Granulosicoccus sp.]|jgi:hypothetical protein
MAVTYNLVVDSVSEVHSLDGMWTPEKLSQLLRLAEFDDAGEISESEQMDMCVMVLQELDHQEAGELVLAAVFGDTMRSGVRQNLVDDLEEDQPWNDIADLTQQKGVFEALILLQMAFPNRYGTPDAQRLQVTISSNSFSTDIEPINSDRFLSILAGCMNDRDILVRLYGDEIKAGSFKDADHIIWSYSETSRSGESRCYDLIASKQWLSSLGRADSFKVML